MEISLRVAGHPTHTAPLNLVGQNLEVGIGVADSLLADRLRNPKFLGPANPQTGIAPEWLPYPDTMHWNWRCELTRGLSLSGSESQMMCLYAPSMSHGFVQREVWIRRGETLEVDLWALAQYQPTKLEIGIRPTIKKGAPYDKTEVVIDAPYWKNYRFPLRMAADDEHAEFTVRMVEYGIVWFDQIHLRPIGTFLRDDLIAAMRSLRPPVLRFPGGCESAVYRWRNGIGPSHLRPPAHDPVFKNRLNYDFGTDEYLQLCSDLGATPHISVAVGSGTPDEAGEWAAHCAEWFRKRGTEPPFMYWHIGNEHNGMWELGNMSPSMYAHVLREFAPRIRRAYPNCRIIALGPAKSQNQKAADNEWRKTILEQAADCFDVLALQMYGVAAGWPTDRDGFAKKMYSEIEEKAQEVRDAIRDGSAASPGKTVAVTEWNLWSHATHHGSFVEPADGAHLMFVAGMQHNFFRAGDGLELVNYYHLINPMGLIHTIGSRIIETPLAELFRWYREALPAQAVPVGVATPNLLDVVPAIDAVCLESADARWLFVVNRHFDEPVTLTTQQLGTPTQQQTIRASSFDGAAEVLSIVRCGSTIELPPLSVSRIRF